jgi:hypothetical protein
MTFGALLFKRRGLYSHECNLCIKPPQAANGFRAEAGTTHGRRAGRDTLLSPVSCAREIKTICKSFTTKMGETPIVRLAYFSFLPSSVPLRLCDQFAERRKKNQLAISPYFPIFRRKNWPKSRPGHKQGEPLARTPVSFSTTSRLMSHRRSRTCLRQCQRA